jgi:hypothetical protein
MLRLISDTDQAQESTTTEIMNTESTKLIFEKHVWGLGIATSIAFSLLSFTLTFFIVCCYKCKVKKTILVNIIFSLISLSIGSLFGDAVIHIMPEIFNPESHDHGEEETESTHSEEELPDSTITSALIVAGFLVFFLIEKAFTLGKCQHSHGNEFDEENSHDGHHLSDKSSKGKNILKLIL